MNLCVEMVLYVKDHFSIDLSPQPPGVQWFTLLWTAVSVYIGLCFNLQPVSSCWKKYDHTVKVWSQSIFSTRLSILIPFLMKLFHQRGVAASLVNSTEVILTPPTVKFLFLVWSHYQKLQYVVINFFFFIQFKWHLTINCKCFIARSGPYT